MAAPKVEKPVTVAFTLDFETGGLDCVDCACTQIAIHAVRIDTFETIDRYVRYISPYTKQSKGAVKRKVLKTLFEQEEEEAQMMRYEEKALIYSDISMDTLESMGEDVKQVARGVIEFIKKNRITKGISHKPFLIGQNIQFDIGFMQQLMEYGGMMSEFSKIMAGNVDFYGNFQPLYIDTILLGKMALAHLDDVTTYKLEILAERFGIEMDDAHDADADVAATTGIAMVCAKRMRNADGDDGSIMAMGKKEKTRNHFKI